MYYAQFLALLSDESGAEIVEYALVAAVFSVGVALGVGAMMSGAGKLTNQNENNFANGMVSPP